MYALGELYIIVSIASQVSFNYSMAGMKRWFEISELFTLQPHSRIPRTNTVNRHLCGACLADASLAYLLRIVGRYTASHATTTALHYKTDDKKLEK